MKDKYSSKRFIRTLIGKEIELGFLYIDSRAKKLFPRGSGEIKVQLSNSNQIQSLTYNAKYQRIFGLVTWYRRNNLIPKNQISILVDDNGIIHLEAIQSSIEESNYTQDELEEIVDLSGLSSMAKGDIVEDRIKEIILLYGQGSLSVYKPVSDSEGIDLIVVKKGVFQPLFIQVKGRFKLQNDRTFIADVRMKTFNSHHSYYVVGAYFNPSSFEIDNHILFVPSKIVKKLGTVINARGEERYRITTNILKPSKSKWAKYIRTKQGLVEAILEKFSEMGKYLK